MTPRVVYLVVDDDLDRRGLALEISTAGRDPWPFPSSTQFIGMLPHLEPAPVVLSGRPGSLHGLPLLAELARLVDWPILLIGDRGDFRTAYDALKLGALDFIQKPLTGYELEEQLRRAEGLLEQRRERSAAAVRAQSLLQRLTPREIEIADALMSGSSNKIAAHQLGISVRTVEMHRAQILRKLGARNMAEAAILLFQAKGEEGRDHAA